MNLTFPIFESFLPTMHSRAFVGHLLTRLLPSKTLKAGLIVFGFRAAKALCSDRLQQVVLLADKGANPSEHSVLAVSGRGLLLLAGDHESTHKMKVKVTAAPAAEIVLKATFLQMKEAACRQLLAATERKP